MLKCAPIITPDGVRDALDFARDCYASMEHTAKGEEFFYRELEFARINGGLLAGSLRLWGLADSDLRAVCALENGSQVKFIFVEERYRRVGLGSVLIEAMSDYAAEQHADAITAYATRKSAGFFTALGFLPISAMEERWGLEIVRVKLEL